MMADHWRTSRSALGGRHERLTGSPYAHVTPRDLNPLPAQSILHSEDISYPTLDIGGLIRDVILVTITAVALVASVSSVFGWVLFFG